MSKITQLLDIAKKELGTQESPSNSNNVKYNTWYYGKEVHDGLWNTKFPWCMVFVQWCFNQLGEPLPKKTASCSGLLTYYKQTEPNKVYTSNPRPGDIVIYNFGHTGIVLQDNGTSIIAIEGNTGLSNDNNGGEVMQRSRSTNLVTAYIRVLDEETNAIQPITINGIHIIKIPASSVKFTITNALKNSAAKQNYANANFFSASKDKTLTVPVSLLKADITAAAAKNATLMKYLTKTADGKYIHLADKTDLQFNGKKQTTLYIANGHVYVKELNKIPDNCEYAVAGIPIMRNAKDVPFNSFVKTQGWDGSELYATWHTFLGIKSNDTELYIMSLKTNTYNMVKTSEAYKKFKALGFTEVLKLDGGGSHIFNVNGKIVSSCGSNRRISAIVEFAGTIAEKVNPYPQPTINLSIGAKGDGVKWVQWQLQSLGYYTGTISGIYDSATQQAVIKFQQANNIKAYGTVGPVTRKAMIK